MKDPGLDKGQGSANEPDFLEKRGFVWAMLLLLLVLTLIAALVLAYLMMVRNFPAH